MNAADREWTLAVIELMCKADSHQRLDEIGKAVAVDMNDPNCYISARALEMVKACGAASRNHVKDLNEISSPQGR